MKEIKKILVPTDFSAKSELAFEHAGEIVRRFGARVDFIHIVPTLRYFNTSLSSLTMPLDLEKDLYPHVQRESREKLNEQMDEHIDQENRGECIVQVGRKPSEAIVNQAQQGDYGLIVMSARGEHDTELLRGGVTGRVIRRSQVPVFTVDEHLSSDRLSRILVPTDASLLSFASMPYALTMAEVYDAEITLLYVNELHSSGMDSSVWDPQKSENENIYETVLAALQEYLDGHDDTDGITLNRHSGAFEDQIVVTRGASSKSIPLRTAVERGVAAHTVIEEYADDHADLVVMATHGHSGLAHLLLGSTAERVVQYIDVPVLTVRPAEDKLKAKA
jgi:nucleotide-binding universal stress UspA family protein